MFLSVYVQVNNSWRSMPASTPSSKSSVHRTPMLSYSRRHVTVEMTHWSRHCAKYPSRATATSTSISCWTAHAQDAGSARSLSIRRSSATRAVMKSFSKWPTVVFRVCRHAVSVCLSVCLSRSYVLSKRINISFFFIVGYLTSFRVPNLMAIFWHAGTALTVASNAGVVARNRDSIREQLIDRSLLDVRATVATDDRAVYRMDSDASVNLCLSQPAAWTKTPKKRKHNRI